MWRTLDEIAAGGPQALTRIARAVNGARRQAWAAVEARHGALPGVRIADKVLQGVTCIRLDAAVTPAHSDKELAEPNFKGFGHHPLLGYCDNTGEPLAGMMRRGGAGSNTTADHLQVLGDAIAALPPAFRRRLMVTADGAGASHGLITRLDQLACPARVPADLLRRLGTGRPRARRDPAGPGGGLADRDRSARPGARAPCAWRLRGPSCGHARCWIEEAHVTELTGLLREGPHGDRLDGWPASMRVFARRERPHPGAQLSLFENQDGWRYSLWVSNSARSAARLAGPAGLYRRCAPGAREG